MTDSTPAVPLAAPGDSWPEHVTGLAPETATADGVGFSLTAATLSSPVIDLAPGTETVNLAISPLGGKPSGHYAEFLTRWMEPNQDEQEWHEVWRDVWELNVGDNCLMQLPVRASAFQVTLSHADEAFTSLDAFVLPTSSMAIRPGILTATDAFDTTDAVGQTASLRADPNAVSPLVYLPCMPGRVQVKASQQVRGRFEINFGSRGEGGLTLVTPITGGDSVFELVFPRRAGRVQFRNQDVKAGSAFLNVTILD